MAGFEPTDARVKVWCLTAWRHPIIYNVNYYIIFVRPCQAFFCGYVSFFKYVKLGFVGVFAQACRRLRVFLTLRTLTQRNYYFFNWAEKLIVVQNVQIPIKLVGT